MDDAPRLTPRQRTGLEAEQQAREHLQQAGLRLVAANVRYKVGEIDLIMRDGQTVVFVEAQSPLHGLGWGCRQCGLPQAAAHPARRPVLAAITLCRPGLARVPL